jgi:methylation protein MtfA
MLSRTFTGGTTCTRAGLHSHTTELFCAEVRELIGLIRGKESVLLELAAGSGRLTLPLARFAKTVVAVDSSFELVDLLRERVREATLSNVSVVVEDMFRFETSMKFDAVVIGTTSIAMFDREQRQAIFRLARGWLGGAGRLVVSLYEAAVETPPVVLDDGRITVVEKIDVDAGVRTSVIRETDSDGTLVGVYTGVTHIVSLNQLRREIGAEGFDLEAPIPVGGAKGRGSPRHTLLVARRRGPK